MFRKILETQIVLVSRTFHLPDGQGDALWSLHILGDVFPTPRLDGISAPEPHGTLPVNACVGEGFGGKEAGIQLPVDTLSSCCLMFQKDWN